MAFLFLSEYQGDSNKKSAQVYKIVDNPGFVVKCFDSSQQIREEIFLTETRADDFAEDWVMS